MTSQKFVEFVVKNENREEWMAVSGFAHKLKDF